jgi:hypothetical protein
VVKTSPGEPRRDPGKSSLRALASAYIVCDGAASPPKPPCKCLHHGASVVGSALAALRMLNLATMPTA